MMKNASINLANKKFPFTDFDLLRSSLKEWKIENSRLENLSDSELEKELISISNIKRFHERWDADPAFQQRFLTDSHQTLIDYNLKISPEKTESLKQQMLTHRDAGESAPLSRDFCQEFYGKTKSEVYLNLANSSRNPCFKAWRSRQIARLSSQVLQFVHEQISHMTAAFELSKGCSVGCWFCSVSAPRLGDIFEYNQANVKLWREVLKLLKEIHGVAAQASFCYWATDPLDNPDYENFCRDFYEIFGAFPQTTTAQALKDPDRTRSLLKLSQESGWLMNRFSILSLKMLDRVHQEFSPEELAFVRLVLQNPEANQFIANAGRAREYNQRKAKKSATPLDDLLPATNSCVSGFLFNMVERSVKLITPCNASERWPLGYQIYQEGTFSNIDELKVLLQEMIERHMPLAVQPKDRISFRRDLKYEVLPNGFQVSTRFRKYKFCNTSYFQILGGMIDQGNKTAEEIAASFYICGIPSDYIYQSLNLMFENGLLDDELPC